MAGSDESVLAEIVSDSGELTADWFTAALGTPVSAAEIEPVEGGLIARMARARLSYEDGNEGPESVMVKYPTDDEGSFGLAVATGMYELEVSFYRDVAPLITASIPTSYFAEYDPESHAFTLVIEDFTGRARPGDVLTLSTLDEAAAVLKQLVGLQAPTWNNRKLQELQWLANPARTLGMFDQFPLGLEPFVERFGSALEPNHVKLFESVLPRSGEWARSWQPPTVVQHGDFRTDNILFGEGPDEPPVTIIDFQTVRLGPPGLDVAYFVGASLSTEDRRSRDRDLITGYHDELLAAGVEGFDFDACWQSYGEVALYGVFLFVGLASQVESTERGDQVIAEQIRRYADMALDLEAPQAAGLA